MHTVKDKIWWIIGGAITIVLLVISAIVWGGIFQSCSADTEIAPDTTNLQEELTEQLAAERYELQLKIEDLEKDLVELKTQMDSIKAEINTAMVERQKTNAKIRKARSISDINSILKLEWSDGSKLTAPIADTDTDSTARGIGTNPYGQ